MWSHNLLSQNHSHRPTSLTQDSNRKLSRKYCCCVLYVWRWRWRFCLSGRPQNVYLYLKYNLRRMAEVEMDLANSLHTPSINLLYPNHLRLRVDEHV